MGKFFLNQTNSGLSLSDFRISVPAFVLSLQLNHTDQFPIFVVRWKGLVLARFMLYNIPVINYLLVFIPEYILHFI
jgi:hypothetical protein